MDITGVLERLKDGMCLSYDTKFTNRNLATLDAKEVVDELVNLPIKTHGLSPGQLIELIGILTDPYSKLKVGECNRIIRDCLYFNYQVPDECVLMICGCLGVKTSHSGKRISFPLQRTITRWLVSVYPFVNPSVIGQMYGLLFQLLNYAYLRHEVAQILYLSTKRHYVTTRRIKQLMRLISKDFRSEPIIALATLYKEYKPHDLLETLPTVQPRVFKHPDEEYIEDLMRMRGDKTSVTTIPRYTHGRILKRRKIGPQASSGMLQQNIGSVSDLVAQIQEAEIPMDWSIVIADKMAVLTYVLRGSSTDREALSEWIRLTLASFDDLNTAQQKTFLEGMQQYSSLVLEAPTALVQHLTSKDFLTKHREFADCAWHFLKWSTDIGVLERTLITYNGLMHAENASWICGYLESMALVLELFFDDGKYVQRLSTLFHSILRPLPKALRRLGYTRTLGLSVIHFIKLLQRIQHPERLTVKDVVLPQPLVYTLLFMDDPIIFSEVCGHLNFCKNILKDTEPSDEATALTNLHNSYVVDVCNLIWRNKAFDIGKNSTSAFGLTSSFSQSLGATLPIFDRHSSFKSLFSVHHTPAFASLSANIVRKLEDQTPACETRHEGPITASSVEEILEDAGSQWLKLDFEGVRVEVLKELDRMGYTGLSDLLFSHLKSLLGKR